MRELRALAASWGTDLRSAYAVACALGMELKDIPVDASRIYLIKKTRYDLCDMEKGEISNNAATSTRVPRTPAQGGVPTRDDGSVDFAMHGELRRTSSGIAFKVSTNPYENDMGPVTSPQHVLVKCTLADALRKGVVHKFPSFTREHHVVVEMPDGQGIPITMRF